MKNLMKKTAIFLLGLGIMSCSVYHQDTADANAAIASENRIKIKTTNNLEYELKELRRENGQLIGVTRKNSETAKLMFDREQIREGNYVKFPIVESEIQTIHLKNKKMSNIVNFGVPLIGIAGMVGLTNPDFRPDVGY